MPTGIYVRTKKYRKIMQKVMRKVWDSGKMQGAIGTKHTDKWKENQSRIMKTKILPQAFGKGHTPWNKGKPHMRGKDHPNWKGGIDKEHVRIKQTAEYKEWQQAVYRNCKWTCADCKKHCQHGDIVAHHIKPFSKCIELRFVVDNGIVLCRKCHTLRHKPRRKDYDKQPIA